MQVIDNVYTEPLYTELFNSHLAFCGKWLDMKCKYG